jgi:hypothetical protein
LHLFVRLWSTSGFLAFLWGIAELVGWIICPTIIVPGISDATTGFILFLPFASDTDDDKELSNSTTFVPINCIGRVSIVVEGNSTLLEKV